MKLVCRSSPVASARTWSSKPQRAGGTGRSAWWPSGSGGARQPSTTRGRPGGIRGRPKSRSAPGRDHPAGWAVRVAPV